MVWSFLRRSSAGRKYERQAESLQNLGESVVGSKADADEIEMIRESAAAVADRDDLGRIRALRYIKHGFDRAVWQQICDLGWPALRLAEDRGGVGLSMSAYCALSCELGAGLVPEPLTDAILSAALLDGQDLADHLSGAKLILPAWQDDRMTAGPRTGGHADGGLSVRKLYVAGASAADAFLVVNSADAWLIDPSTPGVEIDTVETQDGGQVATITLDNADGRRMVCDPTIPLAEACLANAAYLLGISEAAFERTLEYLRTRVQFGRLIGSFQALQHRAVDLKLQVELARASVEDAAARWDIDPGGTRGVAAISRAAARTANVALLVCRQAVQMHGGIGYSDEHDIGLYLRKAMVAAPRFGGAAFHRRRFESLMEQSAGDE